MLSIPGTEALSPAVKYLIAFAIIFVLLALFALVLRRLTGGRLSMPTGDRRSRQPRLGIVDVYDLDRQRQLILLRRDNVEHLLLIGGPNDVIVETNIVRTPGARLPASPIEQSDRPEAVIDRSFEAQPRPFVERPEPVVARLGPAEAGRADQPVHPAAISPEPILKPDVVTLSPAPSPRPVPHPQPVREAAPPPHVPMRESPPQSYREPAPPQPAREPSPPPVQRTVPAKAPPPPREPISPPEHPVMRAAPEQPPRQAASSSRQPDQTVADAAVLSNMAKQLEEALKRPLSPAKAASNPPPAPNGPVQHGEDRPPRGIPSRAPQPVPAPASAPIPMAPSSSAARYSEPQEQPRPRPAAASVSRMRPTPEPEPVNTRSPPPPPPPQPAPSGRGETSDPFSVEEIEAEFARLLGRPLDPGERPH